MWICGWEIDLKKWVCVKEDDLCGMWREKDYIAWESKSGSTLKIATSGFVRCDDAYDAMDYLHERKLSLADEQTKGR